MDKLTVSQTVTFHLTLQLLLVEVMCTDWYVQSAITENRTKDMQSLHQCNKMLVKLCACDAISVTEP